MDPRPIRTWMMHNTSEVEADYHKILTAGLSVQQGIVRQRIIPVYQISNLEEVCQLIIQAFEAGVDFQDSADSFLLMLCLHHAYQGDYKQFLESNAVKYLEGHGFRFEMKKKEGVKRLEELLPAASSGKNIKRTLAAMPEEETTEANAGQFLSFASLFLPKLVVGEKACLEKVQRQIQVHAEQGLIQYPTSWQSVGHMMVIFRLMRTNFLIKFLLIHQGMHMVAGHDANDAVIANSVAQARFSGLLIVKTVLDHILQKTEHGVRLHPLARTAKVKNEVSSFKAALASLAQHGEYAPFARLLNLSGVNNLEHGLFPQLSAIALGVATAHGSTLAGVNVGEQYQQLREAATEAEKQLQKYAESRELDHLGLDDQEKKILKDFHQKKNEISFQQTTAMVTLRKERLAKLTEAITSTSILKTGRRYDDDNDIPFPGPINDNENSGQNDDDPTDSQDTTIPDVIIDPNDGGYNNYSDYANDAASAPDDLVLFDLEDEDDADNPAQNTPEKNDRPATTKLRNGQDQDGNQGETASPRVAPNQYRDKPMPQVQDRSENHDQTLQTQSRVLTPISEEADPSDHNDGDNESIPPLESDDEGSTDTTAAETKPATAPPAPVYRSISVDDSVPSENIPAQSNQTNNEDNVRNNAQSEQSIAEMYQHILKTQGPFDAILYYHMMKEEPIIFSTSDGKEYTYPDSLEDEYPPWLSEKEAMNEDNRFITMDGQQFYWPVMNHRNKFMAILQHHR
ncbi:nucleoprotein [Bundibugyo virus]|uniref:Nucleoprotein n=1 Tax=Bundibugyo virus TaxID=565995 RepID=B8XCM7_9MONO|nr:nucleoprotein [Bundibugyo ebolavirus]ATN23952.1 nucleoprotein [synthetic construct]ACI28620.1 nucleoprotein [Bundibugyo ebolavirus]AKB09560.1 nucleoprotein [Bundibugyo ebolavirus]ALT19767.1 nucleoprotein [Bundibugyo ebolavirus]AYI50304.1 nucleoprotein [Bundibugyo ebolavirus]